MRSIIDVLEIYVWFEKKNLVIKEKTFMFVINTTIINNFIQSYKCVLIRITVVIVIIIIIK